MAQVRCDLSVVSVVLNDKFGLEKTIQSVQNQQSLKIEHIIVDGGSTDGSAIVASMHSSIPIESKEDGGIYPAMQRGADAATGEYLIFCNAGDLLFGRDYLSRSVAQMKQRSTDWGFGPIIELTVRNTFAWVPANVAATADSIIARKDFVPFPSFIIKREMFQRLGGFSSNYTIAGDFELICRAATVSNPLIFTEPIAQFTAGGISYTKADLAWKEEISIRKEILQSGHFNLLNEVMKFSLRVTKWKIGKFLDQFERVFAWSSTSWRDKRALKVPTEYISSLK